MGSGHPCTATPVGFWMIGNPKKARVPRVVNEVRAPDVQPDVQCVVDFAVPLTKISKHIFGNNLGIWVNRANLDKEEFVLALRDMGVSVIRYPGGNASNDFFFLECRKSL